ncbi:MAG: MCE family protein [Candidatus Omnitrophica bacterium]|nr:MCE family protein [Candidatus Omnitrophota bacterium]
MLNFEDKTFELKVGIFIALGILLFSIIVFSIGDVYLIKKGYHVNVVFNFANGLAESAPVRFAGVNVGQIDKIDLFFDENEKKTKVRVMAWVDSDDIKIPTDSDAVINTLGLLGEKYLEIFPGELSDDILTSEGTLIGHDPVPMELVTEKVQKLVDSMCVIMDGLKEGKGTVGKLLVDEQIYDDLEDFVADIKAHPWKLLHKPRGE